MPPHRFRPILIPSAISAIGNSVPVYDIPPVAGPSDATAPLLQLISGK